MRGDKFKFINDRVSIHKSEVLCCVCDATARVYSIRTRNAKIAQKNGAITIWRPYFCPGLVDVENVFQRLREVISRCIFKMYEKVLYLPITATASGLPASTTARDQSRAPTG